MTATATAVFIPSPCSDKTRQPTAYDSDREWRVLLTRRSELAGAAASEASGIACESPDNFSIQGKSHTLFQTKHGRSPSLHFITIASLKQAAAAVVSKMHSALTYQPVARCSVCRCRCRIQGKY
jgi:hypothetical protein